MIRVGIDHSRWRGPVLAAGKSITECREPLEDRKSSADLLSSARYPSISTTRGLCGGGQRCAFAYPTTEVLNLYRLIDLILALPEPLKLQYLDSVHLLEEETRMRYVTSAERLLEVQTLVEVFEELRIRNRCSIS